MQLLQDRQDYIPTRGRNQNLPNTNPVDIRFARPFQLRRAIRRAIFGPSMALRFRVQETKNVMLILDPFDTTCKFERRY